MSTRTRSRPRSRPAGKSYTDRLHQRTAARRPERQWPAWLTTRHLPALLTLGVELGHLAAALAEWPASPVRGVVHVLAAAALGLLAAAVYFGPNRLVLNLGTGLSVALPIGWLIGALAGVSPYRDYPMAVALGVAAIEIVLAGLLVALLQSSKVDSPKAKRTQAGHGKR